MSRYPRSALTYTAAPAHMAQLADSPALMHGFRPPLPFQFPSLAHLSKRVDAIVLRAEQVEGLSPSTIQWMRSAFVGFRAFLPSGNRERAFLSGDASRQLAVLGEWIAAMRARGVSRTTINNNWRALRALFQRIQALDGRLNPLALVPAPRAGRTLPRCLPRKEAEALLAFVRGYDWRDRLVALRNLAIVGVMLLAGLRRGEVLALECGDVDVDAGTLRIRHGKGRDGGKARTAYAGAQLAVILRAYIDARRLAGREAPAFFTAARADRPIGVMAIRQLFQAISRGLQMRVTPHMLRHSYATLLRQADVPDRVAMELLGHSSLQMLQRYSHVFEGEHSREAAKLVLAFTL